MILHFPLIGNKRSKDKVVQRCLCKIFLDTEIAKRRNNCAASKNEVVVLLCIITLEKKTESVQTGDYK